MLSPVVFILSVAIQLYEDTTLLEKGILTVPPLQIDAVAGLLIAGTGFTTTVTVWDAPAQLPVVEVGVIA